MIHDRQAPSLSRWVEPELVLDELSGSSREEILRGLAAALEESLGTADHDEIFRSLEERERLGSTGVGRGFAIPHCRLRGIENPRVLVARSVHGVAFGAPDGIPVTVFFAVAVPLSSTSLHLTILATIARWLRDAERSSRLSGAADREEMIEVLQEAC